MTFKAILQGLVNVLGTEAIVKADVLLRELAYLFIWVKDIIKTTCLPH